MGWLSMPLSSMYPHATAKAYLDAQFTYEREVDSGGTRGLKVLASSCLQNRVYYAAAQVLTDGIGGDVVAIVCLVRWNPRDKDGYVFGYKDMDETMGPCEAHCPQRILTLLTPTDNASALDWRRRCAENLQRRQRRLTDGDRIKLASPMTFTDGHIGDEFLVEKRGRHLRLRDPATGGRYRISRFMDRHWTIVPTTKVHTTIFA